MEHVQYDESFFCNDGIKSWAKKYNKFLPQNVTHLLSAGASGCAIASAMLAQMDDVKTVKHIHIHPENRVSHRGENKSASGFRSDRFAARDNVYCFVDDFIVTGATFKGVQAFMKEIPVNYILVVWANTHFSLVHGKKCPDTKIIQIEQQLTAD